jgi:hypothetical protein
MDKVIFLVYRDNISVKWFDTLKEALQLAMHDGLTVMRLHLKGDGDLHKMIIYRGMTS